MWGLITGTIFLKHWQKFMFHVPSTGTSFSHLGVNTLSSFFVYMYFYTHLKNPFHLKWNAPEISIHIWCLCVNIAMHFCFQGQGEEIQLHVFKFYFEAGVLLLCFISETLFATCSYMFMQASCFPIHEFYCRISLSENQKKQALQYVVQ